MHRRRVAAEVDPHQDGSRQFSVRDAMRTMLNNLDGIDIPAARLGLRPRFSLDVLQAPDVVDGLKTIMTWFVTTASEAANVNQQDTLA